MDKTAEMVTHQRLVITSENHSITGGLGEVVAATLMRYGVTPRFKQIALPTLHDRYDISTEAMVKQIKGWLQL